MKKTVKLTESDLVKIVKTILNEQAFSEIKGTTSKERISNPKVLTDTGLPANAQNYTGRWMLDTANVPKTFTTRSLNLFKNISPTSPKGAGDYFEITVSRFTKQVNNPDKTIKTPSTLDTSTKPKVESIVGSGVKSFNTFYVDPTDPNYVWKISKIVASGNGLLAFSRALVTSKTPYPNKLTIGFSQEQRTSSSYRYDPATIGAISPTFNGTSKIVVASVLTRMGLKTSKDTFTNRFMGKSPEELAKSITDYMYMNDAKFVPETELPTIKSNKNITPYDPTPIVALLNSVPRPNDLLTRLIFSASEGIEVNSTTKSNLLNKVKQSYANVMSPFRDEIVRQYKLRIISYYKSIKPEMVNTVEQIQFSGGPSIPIDNLFSDAIYGATYVGQTPAVSAGQQKKDAGYSLGSINPSGS